MKMKIKLKKLSDAMETKWMFYISALTIAFIFMVASIFYLGKVSEYLMQVGIYLTVTTGVLAGVTISNIENRSITSRVLILCFFNGFILFGNVGKHLGVEMFTQEYIVLIAVCLGVSFMVLCLMTLLSALVYAALFKK